MQWFLNWNTVPMTFNDSWTYLEMLGKCVTQIDINARNIETNRKNIEINRQNIEINRQNIETNRQNIETNRQNIEALDTDLHTNYYTKAESEKIFLTINNSYTKEQIDAKFEVVNTGLDDLSRDIVALESKLNRNGNTAYYTMTLLSPTIEDNVLNFIIPPTSFSGVTVNVMYQVTIDGNTQNISESIHVKPARSVNKFIMYSATIGGLLNCTNTTGSNFRLTINHPEEVTEITFIDVSVEVFTASKKISQEAKEIWFKRADCNGDGLVDAVDASLATSYYTWASTLTPEEAEAIKDMTLDEKWIYYCENHGFTNHGDYAPDVNLDGLIDVVDSSLISSFYSYVSTGGTGGVEGWYEWITEKIL